MSSALVGCMFGAVASGLLSDRFGRKRLLILAAALFALSSLGTALAGTFGLFIANRLLGGVAIGLASNLSPMYIAEIAPARMRGTLVSVNQLTIVIGILLAQVINWMIAEPVAAGRQRRRRSSPRGTASSAGAGCSGPRLCRLCSSSRRCSSCRRARAGWRRGVIWPRLRGS